MTIDEFLDRWKENGAEFNVEGRKAMREDLVAVLNAQPKNHDCGAAVFYELDEEYKTHGCTFVMQCGGCGVYICRHWKECPRCVKRERDGTVRVLEDAEAQIKQTDAAMDVRTEKLNKQHAVDIASERKLREHLITNRRREVAMRAPSMPLAYLNGWTAEEDQKAKQKDTYVRRSSVVASAEWPWYYADMMLKAEDAKRNLEEKS